MKIKQIAIFFAVCGLLTASAAVALAEGDSVGSAQIQAIQERMLKDSEIMALVLSLQNDPDMQALLNDSAIMTDLQAGRLDRLINDPRFLKVLTKPQVKAVEQRMH
ncbi:MAG: hypothetical protein P4L42_04875 [Desulfocapsaceae bacterium]|nr:hypothetical protein [Desulfocapsaceae bacterium]